MRRIAFAAALLVAARLRAHDFRIEPSTFHPAAGQVVSIGLRVGQDFLSDPVPRNGAMIERYFVREGNRVADVDGSDGADPSGFIVAGGTLPDIIAYASKPSPTELPAAKFEAYLRQYGLDSIIAERARRGERGKSGREIFSRCAKSILTGARPSLAVTQPLGLRYEIVPSTDPTHDPGPFRGRVVYERTPRAGALVVAVSQDDPSVRLATHTARDGSFSFALPRGGVWLIKSVLMIDAPRGSGAEWESVWASLTFERR
jgi:hypothetical protein